MFFELEKNDFEKVLPLYLREGIIFPLILAVIRRNQRGRVFVNDPGHPTSAIVVTKFGFVQHMGAEEYDNNLIDFFNSSRNLLPSYLLWYSPPPYAQKLLDEFPQHIRRRERVRFTFETQNIEDPVQCPDGFTARYLEKETMERISHLKLDIGSRFWASINEFLEHGIGACVMKGHDVISVCYSACIADNLAEIDISTQDEFRGMGLATIAAQHFIEKCIQKGIKPTWDCFVNNSASMRLANRLRFTQTVVYPFYSFTTPLRIPDNN